MYRFDRWFGLAGVAWLSGAWFVALAGTLLVTCRRHASPVVASSIAAFALLACNSGLSPRPQVLSYILVAVVVDAWIRTGSDGRPRWWLIPLTWLWAMLHGMWILGVVTSVVAAAGVSLDSSRPRRARLSYLAIPVGMAVAAAITPVGPRLYSAVVLVGSRGTTYSEWRPADFSDPYNALFAVMLITSVALALRTGESSWLRIGLTLLTVGWALYSLRTVPFGAVTIAPLLARQLAAHTTPWSRVARAEKLAVGVAGSLALVSLGLTAPSAGEIHEPSWVRPALTALPPGTPIIADLGQAGYLVWRYQNLSPIMTGYGEMYTEDEIQDYKVLMTLRPGWDQELRRIGPEWALVDPELPIAYALTHLEHWRTVASSTDLVLLTSTEPVQP
jgi:hypothetical protein